MCIPAGFVTLFQAVTNYDNVFVVPNFNGAFAFAEFEVLLPNKSWCNSGGTVPHLNQCIQ